jgi:alkylation response protein AidB-like acyl-CoA dehydrogenase
MYSFEPSEEQKMLVEAVHRYASADLRLAAHDADEAGNLPPALVEKGWELGLLQCSVPESYGGFGERSAVTGVLAVEEMAWGDLAGTLAVLAPSLFALPVMLGGSQEQKKAYLPPLMQAGWQPYTAALVEPGYDFDPNDLHTIAVEEDSSYILRGEKVLVPYASEAHDLLVYARLGDRTQGFIVPRQATGLEVAERQNTLGLRALPVYRVCFNDLRLPRQNRLGGEMGHDFAPILAASRLALAASALGVGRAALEYSRDYAKEREAFGVKIAQKQAIAFMLAEMAIEIEAMRLLTWEAAWMLDQGMEEGVKQAYLAFTGAADMVMMVTDRAVQVLGGHGYIREHPVELWMRNGRGISTLTGLAMV